MKYEPIAKHYYDGLDEGKFFGLKCTECGHIEFPPYPACNCCGHIGNEWVDLADAEVTVNEIYSISPLMTIGDFMPYAPLFACEAYIAGGDTAFTCLVFGVTKKNYKEMREQVPLKGRLCVMPMDGYNSFAVSLNGALPVKKGQKGTMDQTKTLAMLGKDKKQAILSAEQDSGSEAPQSPAAESAPAASKPDNGIDGNYKCTAKIMGQKRSCNMKIVVEGETSYGVLEVMDEAMPYENGTFKDGVLEFSIEARGSEFAFRGTVGGGKISGTVKFGMLKLAVEGEKV